MKRDSIFLLILLLSLCCCSQKNQQAETVKNDSITEFFRNFYTGCNEYFVQRDKADRDNKSDSYRLYLTNKFISFLKDFCYDDIVAEAYNYDLDNNVALKKQKQSMKDALPFRATWRF